MLRCKTLGTLDLRGSGSGGHVAVLSQPKRAALLVYLAAATPRGFHRRDTILALFWPALDQEHARAALRQSLTFLRRELGSDVIRTRGAEEVGLDPDEFWCDAVAFEEAFQNGNLERALDLYQGDFLAGFHVSWAGVFERWRERRCAELRDQAAQAVALMGKRAQSEGRITQAVRWARRSLALAPDDERAWQRLLLLLDRVGDRAGALQAYQALAARLAEEYQTEPSPETKRIVAAIRGHGAEAP